MLHSNSRHEKCYLLYCQQVKKHFGKAMLDRTKKIDMLTTAFSVLSTTITNKSKQNMLDDNRALEPVLADLLNMLYGFNFVDLN